MGTAESVESVEGAVAEEAGPVSETAAGGACAGVVAGSALGHALVGVGAVAGAVGGVAAVVGAVARAEAVVGAVGGPEAAAVVGEAESELYGRPNAGCGVGDHGSRAAAWPLWTPPSSARRRNWVSVM